MTAAIRRLIEVMKREDMVAEDINDEYRRLVVQALARYTGLGLRSAVNLFRVT